MIDESVDFSSTQLANVFSLSSKLGRSFVKHLELTSNFKRSVQVLLESKSNYKSILNFISDFSKKIDQRTTEGKKLNSGLNRVFEEDNKSNGRGEWCRCN